MTPPMIPPTTTDVMPLETESGSATCVSCVIAVDVLEVPSGVVAVESFSVLMCVVVSEDLVVGGIVVIDENDDDDDVMLACVVVTAGDSVIVGTIAVSVLA